MAFKIKGTQTRLSELKKNLDKMSPAKRKRHIDSYRYHAKKENRLEETDELLKKWGYI